MPQTPELAESAPPVQHHRLESPVHHASTHDEWWRRSVIYQVYPRSFRDTTGNGIGDLPGITRELPKIASLGVDALWLSPFFASPQRDAGYDVSDYCAVDPLFGTLGDFDDLVAEANRLGVKILVDIVPNHCSNEHRLFVQALAAGPGSAAREMFIFRDGRGERGEMPPNNWQSHFGGPAWTRVTEADGSPGQYYLHLFDSSQPDFNWDNPAVGDEFERILRFWLDRGAGGFRVDVAHALVKDAALPDWGGTPDGTPSPGFPFSDAPMFGRPGVHDVFRRWREICDGYDGERVLCAEANVRPIEAMADWVRGDEMHQSFNFPFLHTEWDAEALKGIITRSLNAFDAVGAPSTWVLSNHDVARHATRFGAVAPATRPGDGLGPEDPQPDLDLGRARARAATLFMLGLPGGAYLYQGEELGLGDHTELPHPLRQDPTYARTNGERLGRDGCRVPLPWNTGNSTLGFSDAAEAWLPQPASWQFLTREAQELDPDSTLWMYRNALALRRARNLGLGDLSWLVGTGAPQVLGFANGGLLVIMNLGNAPFTLPEGTVLQASSATAVDATGRLLNPDSTVWLLPA
ncbi:glycoside hydrolase family 13 protein [Paeniglutamicibacter sp. NPDC012692]|uniref:glycoside hydrolase family 13 protein n=1 Tax=Paeniglutamicibacter sp. NPDC012692 TaxID=3364388 RepID=UPI00367CEBBB